MPTENRSSNTQMVSVPRQTLENVLRDGSCEREIHAAFLQAQQSIRTLLDQPAPQPHPEPIAWMVGTAFWWTKEEAERDAAATGMPVVPVGPMVAQHGEPAWFMTEGGVSVLHAKAKAMSDQQGLDTSSYSVPLYTHADPGEVERLRTELTRMHEANWKASQFGIKLQAKLAEQEALLRELADAPPAAMEFRLQQKVKAALSSSAKPSVPGVLPRAHDVNMFQRTAKPRAKS